MQITLNMILDHLKQFNYETHISAVDKRSFDRIVLFSSQIHEFHPSWLYVALMSEAMCAHVPQNICFICLRDRIQDKAETTDTLRGMLIVNENIRLEQLFSTVQNAFYMVNEWVSRMQDAVIKGLGMQHILALSVPVIGNYIAISDSSLKLMAYTEAVECDDSICLAAKENGFHPQSSVDCFRKYRRFELWANHEFYVDDSHEISPYTLVGKVFKFQSTYFIHSVMTCNNKAPSPGLLDLYLLLMDFIGIYAARDWEKKDSYSHIYDSLLVDLIEGNLTDRDTIKKRAAYIKLPFEAKFMMLCIPTTQTGNYSVGRLGQEISTLFATACIILYHQQILLLLQLKPEHIVEQTAAMHERLEPTLERYDIYCGCSSVFSSLADCQTAYEQCTQALKYSGELNKGLLFEDLIDKPVTTLDGKRHLFSFEDTLLYCLLSDSPEVLRLWRFSAYGQALMALNAYDEQHETNNLQLLYTYLSCDRSATTTGMLMHMHRNNVIYRVERIEKITGISLENNRSRLKLLISYALMRLHGSLGSLDLSP